MTGTKEEKVEKFCQEYIKDFNATRSAIAAGYSEKGAHVRGSDLLSESKVKARIAQLTEVVVQETKNEREDIRKILTDAANLDLTDLVLMGAQGCTLKDFQDIPKHLRILITEITNVSGKSSWKINFKVFNKEKAVEMLARIYGLDKGQGNVTINSYGNLAAVIDNYPD